MSASVDSMFSGGGERPWHGLGKILTDYPTSEEAIVAAGIDWEVEQRPVFTLNSDNTLLPLPGTFLCRSDNGQPLNYVSDKYQVFQNRELFDFADAVIANSSGVEARYETAGALFGGRKVFLLLRLPDTVLVEDEVNNYLFIANTHGGHESLMAGITNVRVVCNNTLQMAVKQAPRTWRLRHTASLQGRKAEAAEALGLAVAYNKQLESEALELSRERVDAVQEERFFRELFRKQSLSEEGKERLVLDIKTLYDDKDDLQNFRGTKWGLYNAVADFVSNKPVRNLGEYTGHKQMNEFMFGNTLLTQAERILRAA